ncbi:MAG: hypothetical protein ACPHAS_01985 [Synechococcus sp.]
MPAWTPDFETELTQLLKDWLKQQGKTQADLRRSLRAVSTRMPSLLEVLEQEHKQGGLAAVAARLCRVEEEWSHGTPGDAVTRDAADPFGQLDLLLKEIRQDTPN